MKQEKIVIGLIAGLLLMPSIIAMAGPPYMTDDPETLNPGQSEAMVFSTYDQGSGGRQIQGPALEFNHTPRKDVQLHLLVPFANQYPGDGSPSQHGIGDVEASVKYRFLHETKTLPEAAIFPTVEVPTGDAERGLGNGQAWWIFPVWLQKSWGDWTTSAGGGRAFNHAPGMQSYNFGGWLVQRKVSKHLTLGSEVFAQGASRDAGQHSTALNVGAVYEGIKACGNCSLLFRIGHSIAGETHTNGYLGLYWSWGGEEKKG